jgi:hypothetical protein
VYTAVRPRYRAVGPWRRIIRLAVPRGPRDEGAAAPTIEARAILGDVAVVYAALAVAEAAEGGATRCLHPTASKVDDAPGTDDDDDDDDDDEDDVAPPTPTTTAAVPRDATSLGEIPDDSAPSDIPVSCILVLTVSRGWHIDDSTNPAAPPARRCWRGDALFSFFDSAPMIYDHHRPVLSALRF